MPEADVSSESYTGNPPFYRSHPKLSFVLDEAFNAYPDENPLSSLHIQGSYFPGPNTSAQSSRSHIPQKGPPFAPCSHRLAVQTLDTDGSPGFYSKGSIYSPQDTPQTVLPKQAPPLVREVTELPEMTPPYSTWSQTQPESFLHVLPEAVIVPREYRRALDVASLQYLRENGYERETPPLAAHIVELPPTLGHTPNDSSLRTPEKWHVDYVQEPVRSKSSKSQSECQPMKKKRPSPLTVLDNIHGFCSTQSTDDTRPSSVPVPDNPKPDVEPRSPPTHSQVFGMLYYCSPSESGSNARARITHSSTKETVSYPDNPYLLRSHRHPPLESTSQTPAQKIANADAQTQRDATLHGISLPSTSHQTQIWLVEHRSKDRDLKSYRSLQSILTVTPVHPAPDSEIMNLILGCQSVTSRFFTQICQCLELSPVYLQRAAAMWTQLTDIFNYLEVVINDASSLNIPAAPSWTHTHRQLLASLSSNLARYERMSTSLPRLGTMDKRLNKIHAFRLKFEDLAKRIDKSHRRLIKSWHRAKQRKSKISKSNLYVQPDFTHIRSNNGSTYDI